MMDSIKLSKFCIGLAAAIVFGAIFYLFTLDKLAVSAAITIVGTGIASFAGAFAAFKFEKNERINLKKSTDRKSLAVLVKYFEDEKFFLNLEAEDLKQILKSKTIKPLASSRSKIQMSTYNAIFILDYNYDLFSKVINNFGVLDVYHARTDTISKTMIPYANDGTIKYEIHSGFIKDLDSQYNNFQKTLKLVNEALQLLALLNKNILILT